MSKVYTKTGDQGTTGLVGGERVSKSDCRIEAYGEVDHLNSMIGVLVQHLSHSGKINTEVPFLIKIQNKLFDLGSLLACPLDEREKYKLKKIEISDITDIENQIDETSKELPKLANFILPGGSLEAAHAHLCRTQTRNLERKMITSFTGRDDIPENSLIFINRLSDYFFELSRLINFKLGVKEILWKS